MKDCRLTERKARKVMAFIIDTTAKREAKIKVIDGEY